MAQVLFMTGLIMAPLQLFVFPPLIKNLGPVRWMRIGCLLGMLSFVVTPNAEFFRSNKTTLWAMSVATTTLVNCCLAAVRASAWVYYLYPRSPSKATMGCMRQFGTTRQDLQFRLDYFDFVEMQIKWTHGGAEAQGSSIWSAYAPGNEISSLNNMPRESIVVPLCSPFFATRLTISDHP